MLADEMKILIRKISLNELDQFYEFFQRAVKGEFPEYSEKIQDFIFNRGWSKSQYETWIKTDNRYILGAWSENTLVAILDAQMPYLGVTFCNWLIVDCNYQGKRIGTRLLEKFEQEMKDKGVHMTYLYSGNKKVGFYTKVGYELVGNMKKSWFGQDHNVMTKLLAEPIEENFLK